MENIWMEVKKMKIDKSLYNTAQLDSYKKEKNSKKSELSLNEKKSDKVELSSVYDFEMSIIDSNFENSPENSYIQLKYAEYKIRENANDALAMYEGLSKDRVYGLI
jgi:hypothetical protein